MEPLVFKSRRHLLLNTLLIGLLLVSVLAYWYITQLDSSLSYIFLALLIDFPLLGYFLLVSNTIKIIISEKTLRITSLSASKEIDLENIIGYFEYKEPLFEFHLEANFVGAKVKRNNIGELYYFSPGVRDGLLIEYLNGGKTEKIFITPKEKTKLIDSLRLVLFQNYNKKIEEYNGRYYIK